MDSRQLHEWDDQYLWHPWRSAGDWRNTIIVQGSGCYVTDSSGKEYLDAASAALNASCGYNHPTIIEAVTRQMTTLMNYEIMRFSTIPPIRLAKKLAELLPKSLSRSFFCSSGSEAVEAAVKMARMYWSLRGHERKQKIISLTGGYHGSTLGSLNASHSKVVQSGNPSITDVYGAIPAPHCELCRCMQTHATCVYSSTDAQLLEERIQQFGADQIAGFLVEPVMGIGGLMILPEAYLTNIREICSRYDILLMFDETMTSFGRTGRMFCFNHSGAVPDVLISGKGMSGGYFPYSAVTVSDSLYEAFANDPYIGGFRHGHTNSGHATGAVAALATISVIEEEQLVDNASRRGEELLNGLLPLQSEYNAVRNIRGLGLIVAMDICNESLCMELTNRLLDYGVIVRRVGKVIGIIPPLIITSSEVNAIITAVGLALSDLRQGDVEVGDDHE